MEEGLEKYFAKELLDGDNQYYCEKCECKTDAYKGLALQKAPYVFALNLKRFSFDWQENKRIKVNSRVSFWVRKNTGEPL